MRLFLNYLDTEGQVTWGDAPLQEDLTYFNEWVENIISDRPDFIFFFTTDSTDVFEDDIVLPMGVKLVETYRGYLITTQKFNQQGVRIYHPGGVSFLDFANSVEDARDIIDSRLEN